MLFFCFNFCKADLSNSVRLQVVFNFGDGDCRAGKIHTRAREISKRRDARGAPKIIIFWRSPLGLSRLCSATFEQLLAFGATFCGFSNLEQVLSFRAIFEQNIGLEHISSTKKSTISWKASIHANFLKAYHVINLLNT